MRQGISSLAPYLLTNRPEGHRRAHRHRRPAGSHRPAAQPGLAGGWDIGRDFRRGDGGVMLIGIASSLDRTGLPERSLGRAGSRPLPTSRFAAKFMLNVSFVEVLAMGVDGQMQAFTKCHLRCHHHNSGLAGRNINPGGLVSTETKISNNEAGVPVHAVLKTLRTPLVQFLATHPLHASMTRHLKTQTIIND